MSNLPVKKPMIDFGKLLQSSIYDVIRESQFLGGLIQEMNFRFDRRIPTAAIGFDKSTKRFNLMFNLDFFGRLSKLERSAVLMHEILHFTHQHLFRFPELKLQDKMKTKQEHMFWNVAADIAINQYIKGLPTGCDLCRNIKLPPGEKCKNEECVGKGINVDDWKMKDGTPFPKYKSMEEYRSLLESEKDANKDKFQNGNPESGEGPETLDQHDWEQMTEEEKEDFLREAKKVFERTIEKTCHDHSMIPDYVKDILDTIDAQIKNMNYKQILKAALKKTLSVSDRDQTWHRPNKRYGTYAPGSTNGKVPVLNFYMDTSGSISHKEANAFLDIMDGFLKVGGKKCGLHLWHTNLYLSRKYKQGQRLEQAEIQSGGTDPKEVLEHIAKTNPNLSIILTDGYYEAPKVKIVGEVIFVISEGGNLDHCLKTLGRTLPITGLKDKK